MRIGNGYDVHRLVKGRDLILGGVKIDHEMGLDGHSDADVLVHAIMDAILGAAGMGDIGLHFPDNDDTYKDASSMMLLENVMEKGALHNIFFFACLRIEDDIGLRGYRAYNHYCSYKKGLHLGGSLQSQKIFNFQNIPFNQQSRTQKKGFAYMSSDEEEGVGIDVIVPLAKNQ